mgnify:CR=1 FL=1
MIYNFNIGFLEIRFIDIVDVFLVSLLLYNIYRLLRGSVAIRIFIGFLILYFFYLIVRASEMELLTNILGQFMGVGVLAVLILFQKEIRRFLLFLGKTNYIKDQKIFDIFSPFFSSQIKNKWSNLINILVDSCNLILNDKNGALIIISKDSELKFYSESGEILNAKFSKRLLLSIFNKKSPLHDGAVIIHGEKIIAARCILPVSENENLPMNFGMRHRAAYAISEDTDALAIVISEEHNTLSLFLNGNIKKNLTSVKLRSHIVEYLDGDYNKKLN